MKTDIWMPLYIGDYLADTQHLTPEKHGIYLLLMMHYWKQGPLENDLEELACVTRAKEEKLLKVLEEFFVLDGEVWRHSRIDKERAKARAKRKAAQESARKRWEKHADSKKDANAYLIADPNGDTNGDTNGDAKSMRIPMLDGCSSPSPSPSPLSSNSEEKNSASQKKVNPQKHKYGKYQNVLLSDKEYQTLIEAWGEKEAKAWIETLSEGMAMKAYKYKSHYLAIRNWRKREHPEQDTSKISATAPASDHIKPWEDVGEKSLQELHGAVRRSG